MRAHRQKAAVLLMVLGALGVVAMLSTVLVKDLVLARNETRAIVERRQAELLAQSGIERAIARLARDPDYRGETWQLEAQQLVGHSAARVEIQVASSDDPSERRISVVADYPAEGHARARRSRTLTLTIPRGD